MAVTITSIMPAATGAPGDRVLVFGTGFLVGVKVRFDAVEAISVTRVSSTELEVIVPRIGDATVTLTVDNGGGDVATATFAVLPSAGWGKAPHALSIYGATVSGAVSVQKAVAVSTHEVDVTTTGRVRDSSPFVVGDALNPATWQVQRLDSLAFLTVVGVAQVATNTYRLTCLEAFGPVGVQHQAGSTVLLDASGSTIVNPRFAAFQGVLDASTSTMAAKMAHRKTGARDYANVPTLDTFGGTLKIDSGGDYEMVSGAELVKKLIIRRLVSKPGDFFHLPNYGIGLRVKEPLPVADLSKLKAEIERQVLQEPEVDTVQAQLFQTSESILTVKVRARLKKTGEPIEVSVPPEQTGVVL